MIVLAFVLGSSLYLGLGWTIDFIRSRFGEDAAPTSPWPIFAGLSIDLAGDGIRIGAGATISPGLALLLTPGQRSGNIPGAFTSTFTFRQMGVRRPVRILLTLSSLATAIVGATIGYRGLVNQPPIRKHAVLAFTVGALIVQVIEEITPQAHSSRDARISTFALIGGA